MTDEETTRREDGTHLGAGSGSAPGEADRLAWLRAAFDALEDAVWLLDREGRIIELNRAAERLFGRAKAEILGRPCRDVAGRTYGTSCCGDECCPYEGSVKARRRHVRDLEFGDRQVRVAADPILGGDGEPVGVVLVSADVTRLKLSERALARERDRFQTYLDVSGVMFVALDRNGRVTHINRRGSEILGLPAEEILGKDWFEHFIPERNREEVRSVFQRIISEELEPVEYYENPVLTATGEERIIHWHNTVLRDERGRVSGTLSSGEDVTELRRAEAQRKRLEEQILAKQRLESIGRLAGGVAHDFNNLLTVILNYTDLAIRTLPDDHPVVPDLEQVLEAAKRASNVTRQLLAFSRKQVLELRPLNLNDVVSNMAPLLKRLIGEDIHFRFDLEEDLGLVKVDAGQMEQVLLNLVVNARDAMPRGGLITIETANVSVDPEYCERHPDLEPGPYVMLSVSDTGEGMSEEVRNHVFEPFFTTKSEGSGMGLAVVYGVVEQCGGHIWVYSEPGHGTTFKLFFPRFDSQEMHEDAKMVAGERGGAETILVVEDEAPVRRLACRVLRSAGYEVYSAPDGERALQLCEELEGRVHLAILDVVMPGKNGKEVADEILARYPHVGILYTSGYTENHIAHHGVLDEGVDFIPKPFSVPELLKKVREVLDRDS